jgi:hypothetical protein
MIISLAISAVLISLVVKLFTFLSETQRSNTKILSGYEEIIAAEHFLSELMAESDSVNYYNDQMIFYFEDNQNKYLTFYDSLIVYYDSMYCDTLHLNISELKSEFNPISPSLLQSISFQIDYIGQHLPIQIIKEYQGAIIVNSQMSTYEN